MTGPPPDARPYRLVTSPTVRRQLANVLPEPVTAAAYEFLVDPLLTNPRRVGRRLAPPLHDRYAARRGTYRVIYRVDDAAGVVTVLQVAHRKDAYRPD